MDWITNIQNTINYIEDNIEAELDADILAAKIYTSSFNFQRVFSILCDCTLGEYIRNRRLTLAGYELLSEDISILDIAIKYGYQTNESFTRAFSRFHGVTPSIARKKRMSLNTFSRISVKSNLSGGKVMMSDFSERGYVVKETGAVYYTQDMDKTLKWFKEVLGWYGQIDARDEDGIGTYGCVNNIPIEIEMMHIAPFTGIHMFKGDVLPIMVGFMLVQGIEQLYEFVKKNGWNQITEIITEPWGGKTCEVTTIDGSILKFFE
ncbi:helix-turn-helix domain-containing protein [Clostridium sp.]|uniref:helix-turn-helix domain-containing protein n=1 Tax=Clostridium sp. TaxID=1506 RepID=UPI0034647BF2